MMYVRTSDLVPKAGTCDVTSPLCAVKLAPGAPVEPISLRAAAGECINVTLRNRLPAVAPDLAGFYELHRVVGRNNEPEGLTFFNNNLIRPSSQVGLHPGQLAYDTFTDDGVVAGLNAPVRNLAAPGGTQTYRWYAGDLSLTPPTAGPLGTFLTSIVATPVEFGATNLGPADKVKQGQKGLVGSLTVMPRAATWTETDTALDHQTSAQGFSRRTTASATVTTASGTFRDFAAVIQKGMNQRYKDGTAIEGIAAEGPISEDTEDSGQYAVNYGSEPLWFRFNLAPNTPFNGAPGVFTLRDIPNAHEAYSNVLSAGDDPATPVFTAAAGQQARIHVVQPAGIGRSMTFNLHGHVWQRAPYVCPGSAFLGLAGNCKPTGFFPSLSGAGGPFEVASRAIGENPLSFSLGGQDSVMPGSHYDFVLPSAGGANAIRGDYLFRDQASFGSLGGVWGILRVK
jgi:manganese oxidase